MTIQELRQKHPEFKYRDYFYEIQGKDLKISFDFLIEPNISLNPEIIIKNIDEQRFKELETGVLNNLVFNVGLIEMISYFKASCSPRISIEAGEIDEKQTEFLHNLIIKGLGQFFYENKIDYRDKDFLKICSYRKKELKIFEKKLKDRYLVPMGGGRDSIVALEGLKSKRKEINCFVVNPTLCSRKVLEIAEVKDPIVVKRSIDLKLLELNKEGYLNGHTPFTALLSMLSVLCSVLFDYKNIAFSNEKSADEGNVKFLGEIVNHQYSKSSEFEKKFKDYIKNYLVKDINYLSLLRNKNELQISEMFSKQNKYFREFSSCNRALKEEGRGWCGQCPKCLFVYLTLYPYLSKEEMIDIFKKDLFEDKELLNTMKDLLNLGVHKPFECVGTYKEAKKALKMSKDKAEKQGPIPYILKELK